jgi:hypothetical protein
MRCGSPRDYFASKCLGRKRLQSEDEFPTAEVPAKCITGVASVRRHRLSSLEMMYGMRWFVTC